jgi:hypothetical protein
MVVNIPGEGRLSLRRFDGVADFCGTDNPAYFGDERKRMRETVRFNDLEVRFLEARMIPREALTSSI